MSTHTQQFRLQASRQELLRDCQQVTASLGWRVIEVSSSSIKVKEPMPNLTSYTGAVRIDIDIHERDTAECDLELRGSVMGVGPIQRNHLQGQMGRFLNELSLRIDSRTDEQQLSTGSRSDVQSLAEELERLAALRDSGALSAEEFVAAKARLLGGS